jgi:hypothetical protein
MHRADEPDRGSRWVPIASLPGFRAHDSAAMAPPEGPPVRSGEAPGFLRETGFSIQPRQIF